jgi:uncharacterized protein (DUF885 family)/HD superfamily phosphodiesterase
MIRFARAALVGAALLSLGASGVAAAAPPRSARVPSPAPASPAAVALHALFKAEWAREMREHPLEASADGFHRYDGFWADESLAALAREHEEDIRALKDLAGIDRGLLTGEDRISYDLFQYRYRMRVEDYALEGYLMPVDELDGIQTLRTLTQTLRFQNAADYRNFVHRLRTFRPYMDATIALLKQGVKEGMTEPRRVEDRVPHQIAAYLVADPADSPFYAPFRKMPAIIPPAEQARLRAAAKAAIASEVTPAYREFQQYFDQEYLPHCRSSIAADALPNGKAYYAFQVRQYTTTGLTPAQIHAMGLRKVAQIHAQMEQVFRQIGFRGSYRDFVRYLRTSPRFYYKDPKKLLEAYRAAAKRVDPLLVTEFPVRILPRVPYGVRPIPASLAPDTYPAYSDPPAGDGSVAGYMSVNLYDPQSRPKYEIQVLTCHEGRPGHQLQIPIAMGLKSLPDFRRFDYYSSYGEGWALYTETLCDRMGLYDDPYSKFGYLDYQMWRAVRLVVDTGIHSEGWTRAQAVRYFEDNTALSGQNIDTEVDRYIAWPGQALSYMIGELDILRLRRKAEDELGPRFDIKAFHAALLEHGAMPLSILDRVIDRWMAARRSGSQAHPPASIGPASAAAPAVTGAGIPLDAPWKVRIYDLAHSRFVHPAWGWRHSERDYLMAERIARGDGLHIDTDVLFAAAFLHDMAAFMPCSGPKMPHGDCAARQARAMLRNTGFPMRKLAAVQAAERGHMFYGDPGADPTAIALHDADSLDFLGDIGAARLIALTGAHAPSVAPAVKTLRGFLKDIPPRLITKTARRIGARRAAELESFLDRLQAESFDNRAL